MQSPSTHQAIAKAVEVRRIRLGITKAELAARAGMSGPSLSKRISGVTSIDTNDIERLANALEIDPFDLMTLAAAERDQVSAA